MRTLILTVQTVILTNDAQTICAGDSYAGHNATGTYVDTFSATGGCDSIRTLTLTVTQTLRDTLTHAICQGDTFAGHTASGVYSDTLISSGGCDSIHVLNLTVNPLPTAPVITNSNNTLSSATAITYQWYNGTALLTGETNQTLTATQNGTYYVEIMDANGCTNKSVGYVVTGVGIDEIGKNPLLTVYPNPSTGVLNIALSELHGNQPIEIKLYDAVGKVVYYNTISAAGNNLTTQLQLNNLAQGVLMLQIKQDGWSVNKRVVLVK